ncbi:MAG: hypothetical protein K2X93_27215 [Candidatus Obscuribacterales bacterium]|nr:hypothetical protein [Candidatus Obscuribacterales bacterium]
MNKFEERNTQESTNTAKQTGLVEMLVFVVDKLPTWESAEVIYSEDFIEGLRQKIAVAKSLAKRLRHVSQEELDLAMELAQGAPVSGK